MNRIRILLVMIVKNESHIFRRLWDSVQSEIDGAVICDTGSEDGTPQLIRDLLNESGKPGAVVSHEWRDFGWNRTRSFEVAQIWARDQKWDLSHTFALLLDADMTLIVDPLWKKIVEERQDIAQWEVHQKNGTLNYFNTRLIRMNQEWICQGKTHEVWTGSGKLGQLPTKMIYIQDLGDGGSKSNKFKRDEQLLLAQIEENPQDIRAHFYLAQTYRDLGQYEKAREYYQKRRELGGWEEEKWYSLLRMADCSWALGEHGRAIHEAMDAWLERPHRSESLHRMVVWLRTKGEKAHNLAAWHWIQIGEKIPYPQGDRLFIEAASYREGWWEEKGIVGFYVGEHYEAKQAIEQLLTTRGLQMDYKTVRRYNAMRNRWFYGFPKLIHSASSAGEWAVPSDKEGHYCNPSAYLNAEHEIIVTLRRVNYQVNGGKYTYSGNDIFTETDIYNHTKHEYLKTIPVQRDPNLKWRQKIPIWGLEDIRPLASGKFVATCCHCAGKIGYPRMVIGNLNHDKVSVTELTYADMPPFNTEKNWLPFEENGQFYVIYSFEPFLILRVQEETGECFAHRKEEFPIDARGWRGSTPPVKLMEKQTLPGVEFIQIKHAEQDHWGCLIHEVTDVTRGESHRSYWHRWVEWDANGLVGYSLPFIMAAEGIEYPMSCMPIDEKQWFISWGEVDRRARWAIINE